MSTWKPINAATLKYYNANVANKNVGDCVKRAISLALDVPYTEVTSELNKLVRSNRIKYFRFNAQPTFERYLKDRGISGVWVFNDIDQVQPTLDEWVDAHPLGTYLLLVSKKRATERSDHMVAVIDGVVWDSWDSRSEFVVKYYVVSQESTEITQADITNEWYKLDPAITAYLERLNNKWNAKTDIYAKLTLSDVIKLNANTIKFYIRVYLDPKATPARSMYADSSRISHSFIFKISPRYQSQRDLVNIQKQLCTKIYDWWYNMSKEILDAAASEEIVTHPKFRGSPVDLMKLPEWSRSLVTDFTDRNDMWGGDKYVVYMDPLPDDPRAHLGEVAFHTDTLSELKHDMELYRTKFSRVDYDY